MTGADVEAVVALWRSAGLTRPWNDPHRDVERKLAVQPELFLVVVDDVVADDGTVQESVVATAMAGHEGHRGWVHYVAVDPSRQGEGLGRLVVEEAERRLLELGCPKVMLMVRRGNEAVVDFYEHLGYSQDDVVVLGKRLVPDA